MLSSRYRPIETPVSDMEFNDCRMTFALLRERAQFAILGNQNKDANLPFDLSQYMNDDEISLRATALDAQTLDVEEATKIISERVYGITRAVAKEVFDVLIACGPRENVLFAEMRLNVNVHPFGEIYPTGASFHRDAYPQHDPQWSLIARVGNDLVHTEVAEGFYPPKGPERGGYFSLKELQACDHQGTTLVPNGQVIRLDRKTDVHRAKLGNTKTGWGMFFRIAYRGEMPSI